MLKAGAVLLKETVGDALKSIRSPSQAAKGLYGVPLYRNAAYLTANTGVSAILNLAFWILAARLYGPFDTGLGAASISAAMLLSFIGTLGLGFGVIRFLPLSDDKARLLNSSFTLSFLASTALAIVFVAGFSLWSPKLGYVRENPVVLGSFVLFVCAEALNVISGLAFLSFGRADLALARNIIYCLLRIVLAPGFASLFPRFGVFAAWGLATVASLAVCLFIFFPRLVPYYRLTPSFHFGLASPNPGPSANPSIASGRGRQMRFSLANHVSNTAWHLPGYLLPLMVLQRLSAEDSAYFYMSWSMAGVLFGIPAAAALSLFGHASSTPKALGSDLRKALKFTLLLLVPSVTFLAILGDKLLLLFGKEYSTAGSKLLWLLVLASFPVSINFLWLSIVRVREKLWEVISVSSFVALGTLLLSYLLIPPLGLRGVGIAWLATQAGVALVSGIKIGRSFKAGQE